MSVVTVDDLSVEYTTEGQQLRAVDSVSFEIAEGETVGIVGESGCGKTTLVKSLLRLLDENGSIAEGTIQFGDDDLARLSESELRDRIRWKKISYIPQNAMAALDPVYTVGQQMIQVIRRHTDKSKSEARERAAELFERVDLDPDWMGDYPHELSGGQRQRVTIALSLALSPSLIIADEPTTGLDVVVQEQINQLITEIQEDIGCAIIFVTHDMSVVSDISDRLAVMYAGRIVEFGRIDDVFERSSHPYTIGLQNAFPTMAEYPSESDLVEIPGQPPDLLTPPSGCRFAARCPFSTAECENIDPEPVNVGEDHRIECIYPDQVEQFRQDGKRTETWDPDEPLTGSVD